MPPVASAISALAPVAVPVAAGAIAYATVKGVSEAEKARKSQEEMQKRQLQAELEAGEYYEELTREQMELQSQSATINTLTKLIELRRSEQAGPTVLTLPAAKVESYNPVSEINKAIDSILRGRS